MKRQLPIEVIHGTSFFVDVIAEELRQTDRPSNKISFDVFFEDGIGYTFLYDTLSKTAALDEDDELIQDGRYVWVTLRALMELDPEGIALKYGIPLSVLIGDSENKGSEEILDWDEEDSFSNY